MGELPRTLSEFSGPHRESGSNIVFMCCPVCGSTKWKTYVNPQTGGWYCHAPEHSGGGMLEVGLSLQGRGQENLRKLGGVTAEYTWPEISLPAWEPLSRSAIRYLARRGIMPEQSTRLGIVEMQDRMRVIVPYYDQQGQIIYWTARAYSKLEDGPKYLAASGRHPLYVRPRWREHGTLVLVEGVFDAIAVEQNTGLAVAAMGGKALPRYLGSSLDQLVSDHIVLVLDSDALGDAMKIKRRLTPKYQVTVIPLPAGEDPASMGSKLRGLFDGAQD